MFRVCMASGQALLASRRTPAARSAERGVYTRFSRRKGIAIIRYSRVENTRRERFEYEDASESLEHRFIVGFESLNMTRLYLVQAWYSSLFFDDLQDYLANWRRNGYWDNGVTG